MNPIRFVTPTTVFLFGVTIMLCSLPAMMWLYLLHLPRATRLKLPLMILVSGAGITGIGWAWFETEWSKTHSRRRYHRLRRR